MLFKDSICSLLPEVLEGGDHVGLEVVPSQAELLLVVHPGAGLSETRKLCLSWSCYETPQMDDLECDI